MKRDAVTETLPPLEAGELLDQATFHERYEAMPAGTRAELIEGAVHMPSPLRLDHGAMTDAVAYWLTRYRKKTPGVRSAGGASCIMGAAFEPQPDALLMVLPEYRG